MRREKVGSKTAILRRGNSRFRSFSLQCQNVLEKRGFSKGDLFLNVYISNNNHPLGWGIRPQLNNCASLKRGFKDQVCVESLFQQKHARWSITATLAGDPRFSIISDVSPRKCSQHIEELLRSDMS